MRFPCNHVGAPSAEGQCRRLRICAPMSARPVASNIQQLREYELTQVQTLRNTEQLDHGQNRRVVTGQDKTIELVFNSQVCPLVIL